jgi:amino acid transporter
MADALNEAAPSSAQNETGLARGRLAPIEALAQSVATLAPTATPAMVAPLIISLVGPVAWLDYLLAMAGVLVIAAAINRFARREVGTGSLYEYARAGLGPGAGVIAGWALVIAYAGTASALTAGFVAYVPAVFGSLDGRSAAVSGALTMVSVLGAGALAYRDVAVSARLMLVLEATSVLLVLVLLLAPGGSGAQPLEAWRLAPDAAALRGLPGGLLLAFFSFVGFESAAAFGHESANATTAIPRAIRNTALIAGCFFGVVCVMEVAGFGSDIARIGDAPAPLDLLATRRGLAWMKPLLALGATLGFFSCMLACTAAAARILFAIARRGQLPSILARTHPRNRTPHVATVLSTLGVLLPVLALLFGGVGLLDIYGWMGSIATLGFLAAYFLVAVSAARAALSAGEIRGAALAGAAAVLVAAVAVLSLAAPADDNYRVLPCVFLLVLVAGLAGTGLTPWLRVAAARAQASPAPPEA